VGRPTLAKQMDDWLLLPRPERVTELYFVDYRQLSASATPETEQTISFAVHNLEHQTTTYRYTLTAKSEDAEEDHMLGGGSFTLDHDGSKETSRTVTIPKLDGRVAVKVSLEYEGIAFGDSTPTLQTQSIHYWATTPNMPDSDKENHDGA